MLYTFHWIVKQVLIASQKSCIALRLVSLIIRGFLNKVELLQSNLIHNDFSRKYKIFNSMEELFVFLCLRDVL